jgi:hypothetical protein
MYGPPGGYPNQYGGGMQPMGMQGGMGYGMQPGMGMGMQQGMGMGMQPGMGMQASYMNTNWNGYNMGRYNIPMQSIQMNGDTTYFRYDTNRIGQIPMQMFPSMINEFCMQSGGMQPNPQDVQYMMYTLDYDGNGMLSYQEWCRALQMVGGHATYNRAQLQQGYHSGQYTNYNHHRGYKNKGFKGFKFKGFKGWK